MIVAKNIDNLAEVCDWLVEEQGREPVLIYLEQPKQYWLLEKKPLGDALTLRELLQETLWAFEG